MANNVTRMPNRSPRANTTMTTRTGIKSFGTNPKSSTEGLLRTLESARKPANTNMSRTAREAAVRASYAPTEKGWKVNSGKYAYGPKAPSTASKIATGVAKGVARGALRVAGGPVGALASMTTPAGTGSDKPKGPLMTGNSKGKGPGGGSLSAPNRTAPSSSKMSVTGGRGVTAFGGSSGQAPKVAGGKGDLNSPYRTAPGVPARTTPSRSGGASNSKGPAGPSGPNSGPSRSGGASNSKGPAGPSGPNSGPSRSTGTSTSRGPSSGPTSAPSRTAPSKANLGTSRF